MNLNSILTIVVAFFGGLIVFTRPIIGLYAVLIMSPLKTLGSDVVLAARLAGIVTVAVVFLGLVVRGKKILWTGLEKPVIVMWLGMALSLFRTTQRSDALDSLLSLASLFGLVLVIVNLINSEKQFIPVVLVYMASGIYPIVKAFNQRAAGPAYVGQEFVRVSGTFSLPTGLGAFLIPYTLIAFAIMLYPGFRRPMRAFVVALFAAGYIALLLSVSRGAIYAAFIGAGVLVFFLRDILRRNSRALFFFIIILVVVINQQYWSYVRNRVVTPVVDLITTGTSDPNVLARNDEFRLLLPITLDNNFVGTGIGNYEENALRYQYIYTAPFLPTEPHNILLYLFGEAGIIVAIGFFWLLGSIARRIYTSHAVLKDKTQSFLFYMYVGSSSALFGYTAFLLSHTGLFVNDLWISIAFLIVSTILPVENAVQHEQILTLPVTRRPMF